MDIAIDLIILILLTYWAWRFLRAISRRTRFLRNLQRICQDKRYRLRRVRGGIASFFSIGALPDLVLQTREKDYCVRFVSSIDRARFYYFANEEYAVSYQKGAIALPFASRADTVSYRRRFLYLPPRRAPEELEGMGGVEWVLLFNPAPVEVATLNHTGTRRAVVGNGDAIGAFTVYDGRTFCEMLKNA